MIKNNDIICISSIDWDFIWQGHQEIMSALASNGNRILFIENTGVRAPKMRDLPRIRRRISNWLASVKGIRKIRDNLYVYAPLILPFPYSRIARWMNRFLLIVNLKRWMHSMQFGSPIVWTFLPTPIAMDIANSVNRKILVYYCIDNFSASSSGMSKIAKSEEQMIRQADLVFVTSKELQVMCEKFKHKASLFPFGVNSEVYNKAASEGETPIPDDVRSIKGPIIGYVGGVHKWIDMQLVREAALALPEFSFLFIGPVQADITALQCLPNVHFLGQKRYDELPYYVKVFSAGIIPYLLTEYTKNVYPTKLNEYLALGKPVVSTDIPEIVNFARDNPGIIRVSSSRKEFCDSLRGAIADVSDDLKTKRMSVARQNTWQVKIEGMSDLITKKIQERQIEHDQRWKDTITIFYKRTKKRIVIAVVLCLTAYLAVFHTPLIWMIGKPLKMASELKRADVIIVFAGGVGESGKAGQGYEERVSYAVDLYRHGYAPYLLISSGYTYAIKEAQVMKALAEYFGVPRDRIFLDEEASNTYENVKNAISIAVQNNMKSLIVVSSPYHMRRASLVFRKLGKGISVQYAPVPTSGFYGDESDVQVRHIKGIIHEYLGILYYWWRGWV